MGFVWFRAFFGCYVFLGFSLVFLFSLGFLWFYSGFPGFLYNFSLGFFACCDGSWLWVVVLHDWFGVVYVFNCFCVLDCFGLFGVALYFLVWGKVCVCLGGWFHNLSDRVGLFVGVFSFLVLGLFYTVCQEVSCVSHGGLPFAYLFASLPLLCCVPFWCCVVLSIICAANLFFFFLYFGLFLLLGVATLAR